MGKERLGSAELGFIWEHAGKALVHPSGRPVLVSCESNFGSTVNLGGEGSSVCCSVWSKAQ